jgi:hypothetical protein
MVRLSDLLKKKIKPATPPEEEKPAGVKEPISPGVPLYPPEPAPAIKMAQINSPQAQEHRPKESRVASVLEEDLDTQRSNNVYLKGIALARGVSSSVTENKAFELIPIKELVEEIVECFILGSRKLLSLFYNDYQTQEYMYYNSINVTVISIALGLRLGYNKSLLAELGLAAFLSNNESSKILEILKPMKEQHPEYFQIIGIANDYETLTHSRPDRHKIIGSEVLKEMLASHKFPPDILKKFINLIGIYPVGSYVELNTNEIAKVLASNFDSPLRPTVSVILDMSKNLVEQPRRINLAIQANIHIKKQVQEQEVMRFLQGSPG